MRDVLGADCLLAEAALEGKSAREADPANGFDVVLRLALGHPAPGDPLAVDLDVIATQLRDPDVAIAEAARQTIRRDLHMEPDDFARLLTVKTKADPRPEEWVEVYSILTTAQESKREFPLWLAEEEAVQTGVVYWQALKSRLPRWRANGEARAEWRQALNTRAQRPLIDPDLIGQEDLTTFSSGPAFDLWFARRQDIDAQMSALENGPQSIGALEAAVQQIVGVPAADLEALDAERAAGEDIEPALEQLAFSAESFDYLRRIVRLAASGAPLLPSDWTEAYSILVQVRKRRAFARWQAEENAAGLTLGPDHFRLPDLDFTTFPPPPPKELPAWRATYTEYRDWQDVLQTRLDQEAAVVEAMREAASATEEATLPSLRDALVMASDAAGTTLDAKAVARESRRPPRRQARETTGG